MTPGPRVLRSPRSLHDKLTARNAHQRSTISDTKLVQEPSEPILVLRDGLFRVISQT